MSTLSWPELVARYDTWLLDCDGVLWKGGSLTPAAVETLQMLRGMGKTLRFITNASTRSRAGYKAKFDALGLDVSVDEIIPSTYAAAQLLRTRHPDVRCAHVIGAPGLIEELEAVGVRCVTDEDAGPYDLAAFEGFAPDPSVQAVVVGFDPTVTYAKLCRATATAQLLKVPVVVTSVDEYDPLADRSLPAVPIMAKRMIEGSVPGACVEVAGKPSGFLSDFLTKTLDLDKSRTCFVGDRLDSDMMFASRAGVTKVLVTSGVHSEVDVAALSADSPMTPDVVLPHFGVLWNGSKL